ADQPELYIGQLQFPLDQGEEGKDDLAVEIVEEPDHPKQGDYDPGIACRPLFHGLGSTAAVARKPLGSNSASSRALRNAASSAAVRLRRGPSAGPHGRPLHSSSFLIAGIIGKASTMRIRSSTRSWRRRASVHAPRRAAFQIPTTNSGARL